MAVNKPGWFSRVVEDALKLRDDLLREQTPEHLVDGVVGQKLKEAWGAKDGREWHYLCRACRDTGWVEVPPSPEEMRRLVRLYGEHPQAQPYYMRCGESCRWTATDRTKRAERLGGRA